ncbi:MAG: hypothetical protein ACOCV2_00265 [Persicimonas sp.]
MNEHTHMSRARLVGIAALMALVGWASVACDKSPEERLRTAKVAVINEKPEVARENLEPVLEAEPDSFQARQLMAQTLQLEEKYAESEEKFEELIEDEELDGDDLSSGQKGAKEELDEDMVELYIAWAESIEADEEPDKFEEVAKKGLELEPEKPDLNNMLLDFYKERGEAALDEDEKVKAAEYFEGVLDLQGVRPADHKEAREKAHELRFEVNREELEEYFDEEGRAKLEEDDLYDADEEVISVTVEQSIDELEEAANEQRKKEAEEEDEEYEEVEFDLKNEKDIATLQQLIWSRIVPRELTDVLVDGVGVDEDSQFGSLLPPPEDVEAGDWEFANDSLSVTATFDKKTLLKLGSDVKEDTRRAKEKAEEEGDDEKDDKEDDDKEGEDAQAEADEDKGEEDDE